MTKQMMSAMAAMLLIGALPLQAQTSKTDVVKVAPGQKKTTVIHRKNGATDTVVSEGEGVGSAHRPARHRAVRRERVHREPVESQSARELRELREKQSAMQAEIDSLVQASAAKDAALQQAQSDARGAEAQAQTATSQAQQVSSSVQQNADAVQKLQSNVSDLQTTNAGLATVINANKAELTDKIDNPLVLHYKGLKITPVAFFALESVYRTRAINSGLNTPFNNTPFPGSNEGHISEFNLSGRQSRLGGLFEGDAGSYKLSGYFETDFLSSGTTSNSNQSNSYTMRVRQIWGKAETRSGFAVTGGQTWSLVTENGKSTDVRTEKLPNTIDPQYMVGYNWSRQPGIRLQQKFGRPIFGAGFTMAMSVENAQTQLATSANAPTNFIFGGLGTGGGLYNATATYANSVSPDVLTKFALDAKHAHFEFGGLARFFRDEYNPLVAGTANTIQGASIIAKNTKVGGGVFGSLRVSPVKFLDVAVQGMAGDGTARYGSSQLGDVTVRPDGTLEPLRNYHGLFSLETHPTPKLDVYAYFGAEYNQRTVYTGPTGLQIGYGVRNANDSGCYALTLGTTTGAGSTGAPGTVANCASPTKQIEEGTFGVTYRVINSPKYGRLQYQATYSYLNKDTWSGILNPTTLAQGHGNATNNLIYGGMRYYIP
jgi:hypothetical protein